MPNRIVGEADRRFVMQVRPAEIAEIAEIKLSEIAEEYASHREVKLLAHNMVIEHTNTDEQLMALIQDSDMRPPDGMDPEHRKIEQRLLELDGDRFDKEYLQAQMRDHERIIALFAREADEGEDSELADFAQRCLPLLQRHLRNVRELASTLQLT